MKTFDTIPRNSAIQVRLFGSPRFTTFHFMGIKKGMAVCANDDTHILIPRDEELVKDADIDGDYYKVRTTY